MGQIVRDSEPLHTVEGISVESALSGSPRLHFGQRRIRCFAFSGKRILTPQGQGTMLEVSFMGWYSSPFRRRSSFVAFLVGTKGLRLL